MVATNAIAKIAAVAAGLALVASTFAFAPAAKAATFMMDLTIGSTGADVTSLQSWLISKGYSIPAGATGYFGAQTQAALAAYQAANGIAPAAGYFGPITRAHVNDAGGDMGGDDDNGGDDNGSSSDEEGYLEEFDQIGSYSSEDVGEDEEDVGVLGLEMEAVDADQTIERVTVEIEESTNGGSDDLEDYITEVSLWLDDEELDRMAVDDASYDRADDEYTFRFTGLDGVIADGDVGELVVAVTGVNNLDSGDTSTWEVRLPADAIRAVSPNGVDDTYENLYDETFTIETFASANEIELKASLGDENPDEQVVSVENEGDEVLLLEGEFKAEGSDVEIFGLEFDFATSSGLALSSLFDEVVLDFDGSEESENISTSFNGTLVFDDLEFAVAEDDTIVWRLTGISATSSVDSAQGVTVSASLDVSETDAEDASGEDLASADLTGSANGNIQHVFEIAPMIDMESIEVEIDANSNGDQPSETATARIEFDLTAVGGTIYLNGDDETTGAKEAFILAALGNASTSISSYTVTITGYSDVDNQGADNEYYTLDEDEEVHVVIEAIVSQATVTTASILAGLEVTAINYGTVETSDTTRSAIVLNWADLLDELESDRTALVNAS